MFIKRLLLLGFIAIFSASLMASTGPRVGQMAPGFSLTDLKENPHSLEGLLKKGPVLLVFWSTKCHVCHALIPRFKAIHEQYSSKGLTLAAINVGYEDMEEVDDYAFEFKLPYLVLNEDSKKEQIAGDYRLQGTPTIQFIDTDGKVLYRGHSVPDLDKLFAKMKK